MSDQITSFGQRDRKRPVGDDDGDDDELAPDASRRSPLDTGYVKTTGSVFAPMHLERRILLAITPLVTLALAGVWVSAMVKGPATWVENLTGPLALFLALTTLWVIRCRPGQLWKPRLVLLLSMCTYFSLRFAAGLWITAHEGYSTGVMRDMFPPMAISSLLCVFLIPGRRGAQAALGYFALNAAMLGAFFAFNRQPLDPNIVEDLILAYLVGHLVIVVMAIVFSRLRIAYGRSLARAEDLKALALEDALTGVLNRRAFSLAFKRARARFHRNHTPVSLLLLDIDHFKQVNDTLGHDVGDHVLRALAGLLLTDLRRTDEVFRCGGEEFLILLEETSLQAAWEIAERVRMKVKGANLIHDRDLTVSIGVAELADFEGEISIFKRADLALYEAKHGGRDRVCAAPPPQENADVDF